MAIVEIVTQTHWTCWCGNLFGVSGYPVSSLNAEEMHNYLCQLCDTRPKPSPTLIAILARPPLGKGNAWR
jgi:hypothetical protein